MRELILLVDDNTKLLEGLKLRLEMHGYQVIIALDGKEALNILESTIPNLIVADIMMPRINGWQLFENVRSTPRLAGIPFIFLTAKSGEESIIQGKSLGADDYIGKPFNIDELIASIQGRLRRKTELKKISSLSPEFNKPKVLKIHDLTIDTKAHQVHQDGKEIELTNIEFELLTLLTINAGTVCSFDDLAQVAYPSEFPNQSKEQTLRVHIKNLRKKLKYGRGKPSRINNVRGIGYRMSK